MTECIVNAKLSGSRRCHEEVQDALDQVQSRCRKNVMTSADVLEAAHHAEQLRLDGGLKKSQAEGLRFIHVKGANLKRDTSGTLIELVYFRGAWYLTRVNRIRLSRVYSRSWMLPSQDQRLALLKRYVRFIGCSEEERDLIETAMEVAQQPPTLPPTYPWQF